MPDEPRAPIDQRSDGPSKTGKPKIGIVAGLGITAAIVYGAAFLYSAPLVLDENVYYSIRVSNEHIWVTTNGSASVAAFVLENDGARDVLIEKVQIRDQAVPTSSWYYNNDPSVTTAANIKRELKYDDTLGSTDVTGDGSPESFSRAAGPVLVKPGQAVFLYLANPAGIAAADAGRSVTMTIPFGNSMYALESAIVGKG